MKILTISVLFFLSTKIIAQDSLNVDSLYFTSQLKSITKPSSLVIAYRHYSYWNQQNPWQVITVSPKNRVTKYTTDVSFGSLKKHKTDQDTLKKELDLFYNYNIFSMKEAQDWLTTCDSCDAGLYDGDEYSFVVLTKSDFFSFYIYDPGYFVTCCTRLFEHENIIGLIRKLFKK